MKTEEDKDDVGVILAKLTYGIATIQRYETKEKCIKGHKKWIEWAKNTPKQIPYLQFDNKTIEYIEV